MRDVGSVHAPEVVALSGSDLQAVTVQPQAVRVGTYWHRGMRQHPRLPAPAAFAFHQEVQPCLSQLKTRCHPAWWQGEQLTLHGCAGIVLGVLGAVLLISLAAILGYRYHKRRRAVSELEMAVRSAASCQGSIERVAHCNWVEEWPLQAPGL